MYSESMSWTKLYARHGWALQRVRPGPNWDPDVFGSSLPFTDHLRYPGGPSIPHSGSIVAVHVRLWQCLNTPKKGPQGDCSMHLPVQVTLGEVPHVWPSIPMLGWVLSWGYPLKLCRASGKLGGWDVTGILVVLGLERQVRVLGQEHTLSPEASDYRCWGEFSYQAIFTADLQCLPAKALSERLYCRSL